MWHRSFVNDKNLGKIFPAFSVRAQGLCMSYRSGIDIMTELAMIKVVDLSWSAYCVDRDVYVYQESTQYGSRRLPQFDGIYSV